MLKEAVNDFLKSERGELFIDDNSDLSSEKMEEFENKIKTLEKALEEERAARQRDLDEWNIMREDLLLVVKIADESDKNSVVKIESLEKENAELKEELEELQRKYENLKQSEEDRVIEIDSLEKKNIELKKKLDELQIKFEDMKPITVISPSLIEEIKKPNLDTKVSVKSMVKSLEEVNKPKPDKSVKDLVVKIEGKNRDN